MKAAEQKKLITKQIWLGCFNRILFEQGAITEAERNKLAIKIEDLTSPTKAK